MNLDRQPQPQQNHLLAALSPDVQGRLFPYLELVPLPFGAVLYESNSPMHHVYFPTNSIVSLQYLLENGSSTAVSIVGNEGLLGVTSLLTRERTPSRSMVHSAGYAYRLSRLRVKEELDLNGQLMMLMLRYMESLFTQVSQTAVCNRHHSVVQQLCRWILISLDRLSHNHLQMTQEFIGNMMGVRRESVTEAAKKLQAMGAIIYSRGSIEVRDRRKLESLVCECYRVVKSETDVLLDYLPAQPVRGVVSLPPAARVTSHVTSLEPVASPASIVFG